MYWFHQDASTCLYGVETVGLVGAIKGMKDAGYGMKENRFFNAQPLTRLLQPWLRAWS